MPIPTAADQLISDIIQGRAHEYAHEVRQFQASKVKQDRAGEAHEKKQIKFMTSLGLKAADLEASLKSDAKTLDAHLAEYRPPLVSRAGSPAADGKNRSLIVSQLGPGIISVPPYGVFAGAPFHRARECDEPPLSGVKGSS